MNEASATTESGMARLSMLLTEFHRRHDNSTMSDPKAIIMSAQQDGVERTPRSPMSDSVFSVVAPVTKGTLNIASARDRTDTITPNTTSARWHLSIDGNVLRFAATITGRNHAISGISSSAI